MVPNITNVENAGVTLIPFWHIKAYFTLLTNSVYQSGETSCLHKSKYSSYRMEKTGQCIDTYIKPYSYAYIQVFLNWEGDNNSSDGWHVLYKKQYTVKFPYNETLFDKTLTRYSSPVSATYGCLLWIDIMIWPYTCHWHAICNTMLYITMTS